MSDERQPSYDFFPPPKSQPSGPSQHAGQPNYTGPTTYTAPSSHSGQSVAVAPPATRGPAFATPSTYQSQRPWADQIPPVLNRGIRGIRGIRGMPTWLFVLIAFVAGFIAVGILAAIAVPVFLSQHSKAQLQNTTVSVPATFAGLDRGTDTKSLALARTFTHDQVSPENIGIYGARTRNVMVIMAVKMPRETPPIEQAAERKELETTFAVSGATLSLHEEKDSGPLGGWLGCGSTTQGVRVCLATDSASMVTMISAPGAGDAVALIREARAATVIRH